MIFLLFCATWDEAGAQAQTDTNGLKTTDYLLLGQ